LDDEYIFSLSKLLIVSFYKYETLPI